MPSVPLVNVVGKILEEETVYGGWGGRSERHTVDADTQPSF